MIYSLTFIHIKSLYLKIYSLCDDFDFDWESVAHAIKATEIDFRDDVRGGETRDNEETQKKED